jgi:hypothetical protein
MLGKSATGGTFLLTLKTKKAEIITTDNATIMDEKPLDKRTSPPRTQTPIIGILKTKPHSEELNILFNGTSRSMLSKEYVVTRRAR